ncbi:1-acyl-sn-glycerol-3-phosphate acyltransferase [uncultured Prochlorococcus sp.]|uniref:1-acyl-sn-glycerol-3-phosphate acyltransferase n=1 Tax=uncultured Prochlorococcus sp. TaxID=159733 RepID=UPI0025882281|nr:1-acyl-sn-glycerol-3-phosphate acyltransferase [uncultured Prochlorococcus sp.]
MNRLYILNILNIFFRINLFVFSYLLYLIQIIFIFLKFTNIAKRIFRWAAYICSLSLGVSYSINKNFKYKFFKKGIHISNHDNPLDIFAAQYLFGMRTITTVDQHLKNFLPFFEVALKNYGHFCFDYKNFDDRKSAYLFLRKNCASDKQILIYPSGSIYTSIKTRFSKSVSKLAFTGNIKIIAWKFSFVDRSNIEYNRKIVDYILKRFISEKIILKVDKVKIYDPNAYANYDELHYELKNFYLIT